MRRWIKWVLAVLALYAIVEGVTVKGKHYGVSGCDHGVVIDIGEPSDAGSEASP